MMDLFDTIPILDNGNICIIPEFQGKGIGTKILKDILVKNKDRDIVIQYLKQNPVVNYIKN